MEDNIIEPLLTISKKSNKYTMFPLTFPKAYEMYEKAVLSFWKVDEIDLSRDLNDWNNKLNSTERNFLSHILAFFAASDGIVNENLIKRFSNEIPHSEISAFYTFQMAMESIHNQMYSILIDTYIKNDSEKNKIFNAIETIPAVKLKAEWALKWINDNSPFAIRLIAFAVVEGLFFSGSFASIFWLKKRGLMPGLTYSNELISRDEGMHVIFACYLFSEIIKKPNQNIVHELIKEAVEIEKNFFTIAMPVNMIGMNCNLMVQYIEYVADWLLNELTYEKIYKTKNPFDFMDMITFEGKTNFFEKRVSEYQLSNSSNTNFNLNIDF